MEIGEIIHIGLIIILFCLMCFHVYKLYTKADREALIKVTASIFSFVGLFTLGWMPVVSNISISLVILTLCYAVYKSVNKNHQSK